MFGWIKQLCTGEGDTVDDTWLGGFDVLRTLVSNADEGVENSGFEDISSAEFGFSGAGIQKQSNTQNQAEAERQWSYNSNEHVDEDVDDIETDKVISVDDHLAEGNTSPGQEEPKTESSEEGETEGESETLEDDMAVKDLEPKNVDENDGDSTNTSNYDQKIGESIVSEQNRKEECSATVCNSADEKLGDATEKIESTKVDSSDIVVESEENLESLSKANEHVNENFSGSTDATSPNDETLSQECQREHEAHQNGTSNAPDLHQQPFENNLGSRTIPKTEVSEAVQDDRRVEGRNDGKIEYTEGTPTDEIVRQLTAKVTSLQEMLKMRESQLERLQESGVIQDSNSASKNLEIQDRLEVAEKKAQTLAKAHAILKKQLNRAQEQLKSKTEEVDAVMEEGQNLSKRQLTLETTIKKLRTEIRQLKSEKDNTGTSLSQAETRIKDLEQELKEANTSIEAAESRFNEALSTERLHFENAIAEVRKEAVAADQRAKDSIKAGANRKLKDAESRIDALQNSLSQLRDELERERNVADEREDALHAEITNLQQKLAEAEARQRETEDHVPGATAPLLRQLEAMQAAAEDQRKAAAETEHNLSQLLEKTREKLNGARNELEDSITSREESLARCECLEKELFEIRSALREAESIAKAAGDAREVALKNAAEARAELATAQEERIALERVYLQQVESLQAKEEAAREAALRAKAELGKMQFGTSNGDEISGMVRSNNGLPTIPAPPGFGWELVKTNNDNNNKTCNARSLEGSGYVAVEDFSNKKTIESSNSSPDDQEPSSITNDNQGTQNGKSSAEFQFRYNVIGTRSVMRETRVDALQQMVMELQMTRDRLLEELVSLEREVADGKAAKMQVAEKTKQLEDLKTRYDKAVELLGEREEQLEELRADLEDVRESFRGQVNSLANEVEALRAKALE